jgi:PAS domain S-box-containing protein
MFKRKRTLIFMGIVVFLCFASGLFIITLNYVKSNRELALRRLENEVTAGSQYVQSYFRHIRCHLLGIETYLSNSNMKPDEYLRKYLYLVRGLHPETIVEILILDQGGNVVAGTNPSLMQVTLRESEYFDNARHTANKVYLSDAIIVSDLPGLSEHASKTFEDPLDMGWMLYKGVYSRGVFKGAVLFVLRVEPFFNQYSMGINRFTSGYGFILQEDGRILFHRDIELRGRFLPDIPDSSDLIKASHLLDKAGGKIFGHGVIGEHMLVTSVIYLENQRWTLGVSAAASKLDKKTMTFMYTLSVLVIALGGIIFGLVFTLIRLNQAKEIISESEIRLRSIFKAAKDVSLVMADWNGTEARILEFSPGAERMFGYSREEVIGRNVGILHTPEDGRRIPDAIEAMKQGKEGFTGESTLIRKSGEKFTALFTTHPVFDAHGNMTAELGVSVDITDRKQAEEKLAKYREHLEDLIKERTAELEKSRQALINLVEDLKNTTEKLKDTNIRLKELDHIKSVFLASMSHELRTPLNSIIGFTGIMLMGLPGDLNEEQKKQLAIVKNSADHLLSLINDVLDISKIEAGRIEFSLKEFKLQDTLREVIETISSSVAEKGLELVMDVPEDITLFSDRRRVKQILLNIAGNAVKFTDRGSIRIEAKTRASQDLEITIADTGIGIKEEDLGRLFQPFQQIDTALTKKFDGTGLGLHISQKLASIMGGHISVKSEYGKGSEFTLSLPRSV